MFVLHHWEGDPLGCHGCCEPTTVTTTAFSQPRPQTLLGTKSCQALLELGPRAQATWLLPGGAHRQVLERSLLMRSSLGWQLRGAVRRENYNIPERKRESEMRPRRGAWVGGDGWRAIQEVEKQDRAICVPSEKGTLFGPPSVTSPSGR